MSRHERIIVPPLAERDFVLATDLDGTFLGGSRADRDKLYAWIEAHRSSIGLIYVTGRDAAYLNRLPEQEGVPAPDFVIGDVGTTIARYDPKRGVMPLVHLEQHIKDLWASNGDKVLEVLKDWPGLTPQRTAWRYRISFDMDPETFHPGAKDRVEALGLDWLISDERFFDVLPKGVSKGPSLKRLIATLGIVPSRVLCAGDTLNDLSMLTCGLPAVAVGNAEPALRQQLAPAPTLYRAKAAGAGGILEAISAFSLHDTPPA